MDCVFTGCARLRQVTISYRYDELTLGSDESKPLFATCPLDSVFIGGDITYKTEREYGFSPFYGNTSLRKVFINDQEREITESMFYGCTKLKSVTIGDGVTTIDNYAFAGCKNLENLTFGSRVMTIGKDAFSECEQMKSIISRASTPPDCDIRALNDINKMRCKLVVPQGSIAAYKTAKQWKDFFVMDEDSTPTMKCSKPSIHYSNGKLTFSSDTDGVEYLSTITDTDITTYTSSDIQLSVTYQVSVYATKSGYSNSDVATATLCWIDVEPKTEGITDVVANVRACTLLIQTDDNLLYIQGLEKGTDINIYNTAGQLAGSAKATVGITTINTTLKSGEVGIVKINDKAIKIMMK